MSNSLEDASESRTDRQSPSADPQFTPPSALPVFTLGFGADAYHHIPLVVLVGPDTHLLYPWRAHLSACGYAVMVVATLEAIPLAVQPDALVLDADHLSIEAFDALCGQQTASIPLVIVSRRDDIVTRLQAVRVGANSFLPLPIDPVRLGEELDRLTVRLPLEPYRVLLVRDTLPAWMATLRDAGMVLCHIAEPEYILQEIDAFAPDILLIDTHLAKYSSYELAAVVRQQATFVSLPIVMLADAHAGCVHTMQVQPGDHDMLVLPLAAEDLMAAVANRVERARIVRQYIARDGLTGLLNRSTIMAQLFHEIARAERCQTPLSLAMLDVDRFKVVNDTYGHMAGDQVLKRLGRLLRQRLRATDSIGRYGGEEFLVILPGADGPAAQHVLEDMLRSFGHVRHHSGDASWHTTFSCGIASMQHNATQFIAVADAALYAAKQNGRNQVVLGTASERVNVVAR